MIFYLGLSIGVCFGIIIGIIIARILDKKFDRIQTELKEKLDSIAVGMVNRG